MSLPRPYTSYNLFSQLEREHILQTLLGFTPTVSQAERFDPNNYPDMPPLPPRYDGLVLLWDWHLPGKTQRRKRKHRKTHGKIGFHDLNQRISKAWSAADDDVRNFCTVLSEIESRKYKKTKKEEKKKQRKSKALKAKAPTEKEQKSDFHDFDWTVNVEKVPSDDIDLALAGSHCVVESSIWTVKYSRIISFNDGCEEFSPRVNNDGNLAQVDMSDDEIINVWRSTQVENQAPIVATPLLATSAQDVGRTSFIDAEYERFINLGKEFKATKQRSPLPNRPRRLTISACQA